ncbi:MAG: SURF1 family protein [Roseateles sp.]|uniref:SURF1 family protein n=1 Tax=Roseateles sp. TaxID=1971397 RepID=UPI004036BC9C
MSRAARIALIVATALSSIGLLALAAWQWQRLGWKQNLIARVEQRLNAEPVAPPLVASQADEYRRVRVRGRFEPRETLVQANTELGGGYWVLAPLRLADGRAILVNRGFVPPDRRAPEQHAAPDGTVELTGLLRLTEPGGGPLRKNVPAEGRWYSRDVAGIASQLGVADRAAPYFVDESADAAQPQRYPRPGLTVIRFANNHAVYAATWLALAAMAAAAAGYLMREERRAHAP